MQRTMCVLKYENGMDLTPHQTHNKDAFERASEFQHKRKNNNNNNKEKRNQTEETNETL